MVVAIPLCGHPCGILNVGLFPECWCRLPKLNYVVQNEEDIGDAEIEVPLSLLDVLGFVHSSRAVTRVCVACWAYLVRRLTKTPLLACHSTSALCRYV